MFCILKKLFVNILFFFWPTARSAYPNVSNMINFTKIRLGEVWLVFFFLVFSMSQLLFDEVILKVQFDFLTPLFCKRSNQFEINIFFSDGTSSGTCANGYGVCCICKCLLFLFAKNDNCLNLNCSKLKNCLFQFCISSFNSHFSQPCLRPDNKRKLFLLGFGFHINNTSSEM